MTVDWFVLLTPAVLLVVAMPLLFVGCTPFDTAEGSTTTPGPPLVIAPPSTATTTTFRLEMDSDLQRDLNSKLVRIEVTWSLESSTGAPFPIVLPQPAALITTKKVPPPVPPAIDPLQDPGAVATIPSAGIGARDRVRCTCKTFLNNGNTTSAISPPSIVLEKDRTHEFRIQSRRPQQSGWRVYHNGA